MTGTTLVEKVWEARRAVSKAPAGFTLPALDRIATAAYAAYGEMTGGRNYEGKPLPAWDNLGDKIQWAWRTAVAAAIDKAADGRTPPGALSTELATVAAVGNIIDKPRPCAGFQWIGQAFHTCDRCGRPAWEHVGEQRYAKLLDRNSGYVREWEPGEADRIRAKWEPDWHHQHGCRETHGPNCPTRNETPKEVATDAR